MNRREVLSLGAAATAGALTGGPLRAQGRAERVLILGGTGFIGPHFVDALTRRRPQDHAVQSRQARSGSCTPASSSC